MYSPFTVVILMNYLYYYEKSSDVGLNFHDNLLAESVLKVGNKGPIFSNCIAHYSDLWFSI